MSGFAKKAGLQDEPKAGPINDAKQYADALHEIMQNKMPSEQMNAVKMLIENTTSEALQAIIDNMSEEDLIKFMSLQRHIIDGTFEKIKRIHGVTESEVIKIMRTNLKHRSFKLWRTRVTGRTRKHEKKRNLSEKSFKYESYL